MKRPPKPPFALLRSLPYHPEKSLKRQNKNVNPENPPVQNRQPHKKVATRKDSNPKPKKQPKTQKAKPESRNFHQTKSRNLKISGKRKSKNLQKSSNPSQKPQKNEN
ncbi:MAG: hypothetical protein ABR909_02340 [Candidatus Bathyarchaeia archaeon]|jgi:hypothetical protein